MAITWADVEKIAPELATLDAAIQTVLLGYVSTLLSAEAFGSKLDMASTYLAAHLGTLTKRGGDGPAGPLVAETMSKTRRQYALPPSSDSSWGATPYGQVYLMLVDGLAVRVGVVL